jgi:pimeloyl-[acyl-carrier protein] methyl ester esterase
MHSGLWREFAMQVAEQYQVTLVDLPGHGHSEALDQYSMSRVVTELAKALPEPAIWLGWSMGGAVVLQLADEFPDFLKAIILVCANPKYSKSNDWSMAMDGGVLDTFARALRDNDQITLARFTGLMTQGEGESARDLLRFVRKRLPQAPSADRNALLWGLDVLQNADLRSVFQQIKQPLCVVLGEHDPLIPSQVANELTLLNSDAEIQVLKNAGHCPFLSQPQQMKRMVTDFMQRVDKQ